MLLVRLAKNHPLPDGNKRAAWVSLRMFVEVNGWTWSSYPDIDDAESTVLAISASDIDEAGTASWLRRFLAPPEQG